MEGKELASPNGRGLLPESYRVPDYVQRILDDAKNLPTPSFDVDDAEFDALRDDREFEFRVEYRARMRRFLPSELLTTDLEAEEEGREPRTAMIIGGPTKVRFRRRERGSRDAIVRRVFQTSLRKEDDGRVWLEFTLLPV